jgi:hypothetical protein
MRKVQFALALAAAAAALAVPAIARADVVTTWNTYASSLLTGPASTQAPPVASIHLAMVHGAMYDAVNAIDGSHEGYLLSSRVGSPFDSKDAAAATAAYRVLLNILPLLKIVPSPQATLEAQYTAYLAGIPDDMQKTRGIAVGEAAAAAMIAARTGDGRFGAFRNTPGMLAGEWRPTLPSFVNDPNAWVKDVKPFMVESASQFRPKGPDALTSRRYTLEYNEVKSLGQDTSTTRTADQTAAARYWATAGLPLWNRMAATLAAAHGLSVADDARLFAEIYMTAADAAITVFDGKAFFKFWRPITAIREGDNDSNPATAGNKDWLPLIATPPYSDHPSGLNGITAAVVSTYQDFFGTNDIALTDTSPATGLTRTWPSLSAVMDEAVDVRVWSGLHFRNADVAARRIGRDVAKWRQHHFFQPVRGGNDDDDGDDDD